MPSADDSKKRKQAASTSEAQIKRKRPSEPSPRPTLITPHQPIITTLSPKYTILPLSIISSTQIQTRVTSTIHHLLDHPEKGLVLLYARPAEVCKLITVVEQCKRLLKGEGRAWWQYNEMVEMEREEKKQQEKKVDLVEKTVLEGAGEEDEEDGEEEEDDDFEVMESRFEKAVLPPSRPTVVKSLRVFLALNAVQELKTREGVTVQTSEDKPA